MKNKKRSAFTFIELAIVVGVIAVLVSVVIYGANSLIAVGNINRARAITASSPVPNIEGLVAWYETTSKNSLKAEETVDGNTITQWRDISPYSFASTNNTTPTNVLTPISGTLGTITYVKDGIGSVPSIRFTPVSSSADAAKFQISSFAQGGSSQTTLFVVYNQASSGVLFDNQCGERSMWSTMGFWWGGIGTHTSPGFTVVSGQNYIAAVSYNSIVPAIAYLNNVNGTTFATTATAFTPTCGISVGGYQAAMYGGFSGMISEVIVFNRILNLNERKAVMSYLSKKYKIYVAGV